VEAKLKATEAELAEILEEAEVVLQSLTAQKAGRPSDAPIQCSKETLLARDQALYEEQRRLKKEIKLIRAALPSPTALPADLSSAASTASRDGGPPKKKLQTTLAGFVVLVDSNNPSKMTPLAGPKTIEAVLRECPECLRNFKSVEGLNEHMRHCAAAQVAQERQREERRRQAAARVQVAPASPESGEESDAEVSDAESHEGRAPAQAATAAASSVAASTVKAKSNRGGQPVRKSYTFLFKLRVVEFVRAWETEHAG